VFERIAVAVHFEDVDVVGRPVEQRTGQPLGPEHAGPMDSRFGCQADLCTAVSGGMRPWLCAPDRTDGEEAAWNPRPPNSRVSVVAHNAPHCPADKLLGRVKRAPIRNAERLESAYIPGLAASSTRFADRRSKSLATRG
jgi:hypothetical protein